MDIRSMDGKVRPTISGPLAGYIRDLLSTGLYGNSASEVVQTLVREGVQRAVVAGLIGMRGHEPRSTRLGAKGQGEDGARGASHRYDDAWLQRYGRAD